MKQAITQQDEMGCGVACMAFAANISYQEAVALFLAKQKLKRLGFICVT